MQVKFWGVRGSIPSPLDPIDYESRIKEILKISQKKWKDDPYLSIDKIYEILPPHLKEIIGGNTTCVELKDGNEQLIFDMGTGARRLGYDMMAKGIFGHIHILLTHTHWDHIQGWPFFIPGYIPTNHIHFYSAFEDCEERFITQQRFQFFPLGFHEMMSKREFHYFKVGDTFQIGSFIIKTEALIHPGNSVAYRIEKNNKSFIFATDTEFFGSELTKIIKKKKKFFENADVLVIDAQYSLKEAEQKIGWGHTCMVIAVDCAVAWNVKRLYLTHHEPAHDDYSTYQLFEEAKDYLKEKYPNSIINIELAKEGMVIDI
ncbi:MAG: MBL fold metallo-hydrolase [Leptospiraceae bacterium]|nr:MBL fold metallo-hydrolase [Leptospiraceae bacterium]MDW7975283.1 MBL fold metallo-hydrolase [Leptospiraceae bacterium]